MLLDGDHVSALAAAGILYNRESYASLVSAFLYFSNYWNILGWGNLPAGLGILWSLAVEEHYYLLFPLLYAWFVRRAIGRRHQAGILLVLCRAALAWRCYRSSVMHSSWEDIYEGTDTRFDSILAGCVLAIVANPRLGDRAEWFTKHAVALAWSGAAVIVLCCLPQPAFPRHCSLHASRDRADADLLPSDASAEEFCGAMPRVASLATPGAAFLHHVSDPSHAVSPLLSLLPAERVAGGWNSRGHRGVCPGYAQRLWNCRSSACAAGGCVGWRSCPLEQRAGRPKKLLRDKEWRGQECARYPNAHKSVRATLDFITPLVPLPWLRRHLHSAAAPSR